MSSNAEVAFLAAGQQPPVKKPAGLPNLRECSECGGRIKVVNGQLDTHNQHIVTKTGIREGDQPCNGSGRRIKTTATRTTTKEK